MIEKTLWEITKAVDPFKETKIATNIARELARLAHVSAIFRTARFPRQTACSKRTISAKDSSHKETARVSWIRGDSRSTKCMYPKITDGIIKPHVARWPIQIMILPFSMDPQRRALLRTPSFSRNKDRETTSWKLMLNLPKSAADELRTIKVDMKKDNILTAIEDTKDLEMAAWILEDIKCAGNDEK